MTLHLPQLQRLLWTVLGGALLLALLPTAVLAQDGKLKFEIYQDAAKEYRWRLKDGDKIMATAGEGYKAKESAKKGIERIQADVAGDKLTFETYEDKAKEIRWRLKVPNGQTIASSSGAYKDKAEADKAIAVIKKGAAKAELVEVKP